jgi:hypothetical protein
MKNNRFAGKYRSWAGIFIVAILVIASCLPATEQHGESRGAIKVVTPPDPITDTTVYPLVDPHMILYKEAFRRYMNRHSDSSDLP